MDRQSIEPSVSLPAGRQAVNGPPRSPSQDQAPIDELRSSKENIDFEPEDDAISVPNISPDAVGNPATAAGNTEWPDSSGPPQQRSGQQTSHFGEWNAASDRAFTGTGAAAIGAATATIEPTSQHTRLEGTNPAEEGNMQIATDQEDQSSEKQQFVKVPARSCTTAPAAEDENDGKAYYEFDSEISPEAIDEDIAARITTEDGDALQAMSEMSQEALVAMYRAFQETQLQASTKHDETATGSTRDLHSDDQAAETARHGEITAPQAQANPQSKEVTKASSISNSPISVTLPTASASGRAPGLPAIQDESVSPTRGLESEGSGKRPRATIPASWVGERLYSGPDRSSPGYENSRGPPVGRREMSPEVRLGHMPRYEQPLGAVGMVQISGTSGATVSRHTNIKTSPNQASLVLGVKSPSPGSGLEPVSEDGFARGNGGPTRVGSLVPTHVQQPAGPATQISAGPSTQADAAHSRNLNAVQTRQRVGLLSESRPPPFTPPARHELHAAIAARDPRPLAGDRNKGSKIVLTNRTQVYDVLGARATPISQERDGRNRAAEYSEAQWTRDMSGGAQTAPESGIHYPVWQPHSNMEHIVQPAQAYDSGITEYPIRTQARDVKVDVKKKPPALKSQTDGGFELTGKPLQMWCDDIINWMRVRRYLNPFLALCSGRACLSLPNDGIGASAEALAILQAADSIHADLKRTGARSILTGASPITRKVVEFTTMYPLETSAFVGDAELLAEDDEMVYSLVRESGDAQIRAQVIDPSGVRFGFALIVHIHNECFQGVRLEDQLDALKDEFLMVKPRAVRAKAHHRNLRALMLFYECMSGQPPSQMFTVLAQELSAIWKTYTGYTGVQAARLSFEGNCMMNSRRPDREGTFTFIELWQDNASRGASACNALQIAPMPAQAENRMSFDTFVNAIQQKLTNTLRQSGKPARTNTGTRKPIAVTWILPNGKCKFCGKPGTGPIDERHRQCGFCRMSCEHSTENCPHNPKNKHRVPKPQERVLPDGMKCPKCKLLIKGNHHPSRCPKGIVEPPDVESTSQITTKATSAKNKHRASKRERQRGRTCEQRSERSTRR